MTWKKALLVLALSVTGCSVVDSWSRGPVANSSAPGGGLALLSSNPDLDGRADTRGSGFATVNWFGWALNYVLTRSF